MIRGKYIDTSAEEYDYIRPYGAITNVESGKAKYSTLNGFRDYETIDVDIKFRDSASYRQFVHDLRVTQRLRVDETLREKYPAVKHAWDEYQLLLKITK